MQAAEAPWREKKDQLDRYRSEKEVAEDEAALQVGKYQSSLAEVETKHRACQK
jgi:DNA repair protein RAD50